MNTSVESTSAPIQQKTPKPILTLRRRIQLSMFFITLFVCTALSYIATQSLEWVEEDILASHFQANADWLITQYRLSPTSFHQVHNSTRLYVEGVPEMTPPDFVQGLSEGWHEYEFSSWNESFVYIRTIDGVRYVAVSSIADFEEREYSTLILLIAASTICIVLALILSVHLSNMAMRPLTQLARNVTDNNAYPLAPNFPDDELGQLAHAFDTRVAELSQTLARERWFTGDVSHELRTPLMVIQGATELMRNRLNDEHATAIPASQWQTALARIERASRSMSLLVEAFLHMARKPLMQTNKGTTVSVKAVVERLLATQIEPSQQSRIIIEAPMQDVSISAPPQWLDIVLGNLLRNAVQHAENPQVYVSWDEQRLTIRDNGPGLPQAVEHRIQSLNHTSSQTPELSGLGLAIAYRLCAFAHWRLNYTRQSAGNCFELRWAPEHLE